MMKAVELKLAKGADAVFVTNLEEARQVMLDQNWPGRAGPAYNKVLNFIATAQAGHMRNDVAFAAFLQEATDQGIVVPAKKLFADRKH